MNIIKSVVLGSKESRAGRIFGKMKAASKFGK